MSEWMGKAIDQIDGACDHETAAVYALLAIAEGLARVAEALELSTDCRLGPGSVE